MERTRLEVLHRESRITNDLDRPQGGAARLRERPPGICKPDPAPVPLQKLKTDGLLEVVQLLRDRRLGQEE